MDPPILTSGVDLLKGRTARTTAVRQVAGREANTRRGGSLRTLGRTAGSLLLFLSHELIRFLLLLLLPLALLLCSASSDLTVCAWLEGVAARPRLLASGSGG
jgi:hypothetical protein